MVQRHTMATLREAAHQFGLIHPDSVSNLVRRAERQLSRSPEDGSDSGAIRLTAGQNAANGVVGFSSLGGVEFASPAAVGLGTFVDFDLGYVRPIVGFDFIDRFAAGDKTTSFNLIFSNDTTFDGSDTTLSFTKGRCSTFTKAKRRH
ncbi:MAG: hypothetical protein WD030_04575 [Pirellulales bacterium]